VNSWLRWFGILLVTVIALIAVAVGVLYALSGRRLAATWEINLPALTVPTDSAAIARGGHVARTRGCMDCHGDALGGRTFIDVGSVGRFSGSNLTEGGVGGTYTDADWIRAIRHGVAPDGRALLLMPSHEYSALGIEDLTSLVAYLKTIAPIAGEPPPPQVGPMGRFLLLRGELPLIAAERIDHDIPPTHSPAVGPTLEYGAYLAVGCAGCHGQDFAGGRVPGVPDSWPLAANLTPDSTGLGLWSEEAFIRVLRTGRGAGDRALNPDYMPWTMTSHMTPDELNALWQYFQSLTPVATGTR